MLPDPGVIARIVAATAVPAESSDAVTAVAA
jgi:hypothetical protein